MKHAVTSTLAAIALFAAAGAQAAPITTTITDTYWGGDAHGYGDVIGGATYDIKDATITRTGSVLTISIATNFAGHAGVEPGLTRGGIGYGDLFLAETWTPSGTDAAHAGDNAANGTLWSYGFALENRYSNTGGSFKLYQLNGATNSANIKNSESIMTCALGSACYYRNGQATAVDTASANVYSTGHAGTWTVTPDQALLFKIDLASTELMKYSSLALHWGETCQNDVIEGQVQMNAVPVPGVLPLLALGLVALGASRRRARRG